MTSTTGEHALCCVLDEALRPCRAEMPAAVRTVVERIGENCEPSLCSVALHGGRRRVAARRRDGEPGAADARRSREARRASPWAARPCYLWPGGGITIMADVLRMPDDAFGYVPTPALVAPIEFTLPRALYARARRPHGPEHRAGRRTLLEAASATSCASRPGTRQPLAASR